MTIMQQERRVLNAAWRFLIEAVYLIQAVFVQTGSLVFPAKLHAEDLSGNRVICMVVAQGMVTVIANSGMWASSVKLRAEVFQ